MGYLVSTEQLGWPGQESGVMERAGIFQKRLQYPIDPSVATATCHLQRSPEENALCGFPWEGLIQVPGGRECEALRPKV